MDIEESQIEFDFREILYQIQISKQKKTRARHETINGRLKKIKCLSMVYRHQVEKHVIVFQAVVCIVQLSFNCGEKPYQCSYWKVECPILCFFWNWLCIKTTLTLKLKLRNYIVYDICYNIKNKTFNISNI